MTIEEIKKVLDQEYDIYKCRIYFEILQHYYPNPQLKWGCHCAGVCGSYYSKIKKRYEEDQKTTSGSTNSDTTGTGK